MPIRLCAVPTCGRPVTAKGRCDEHRKELERNRSRARREDARQRNRMYASAKWANTRKAQLFRQPLCELEGPGCRGIANEVHHIVAMDAGGAPYDFDNLISTCKPCHSRETRTEQHTRGREGR